MKEINAQIYDCVEIKAKKDEKACVKTPFGNEMLLEAFLKGNLKLQYSDEGYETAYLTDKEFIIRFFPDKCGIYEIKTEEELYTLTVKGGSCRGYVKVSRRDRRYFSYSDGSSYFPIGINLCYPAFYPASGGHEFKLAYNSETLGLRQYERWFKECSRCGVNMARIWLGHEYWSPDTEEAGAFNRVQLAKIEKLVELAGKYDIKLKLTIEQFRYFSYGDSENGEYYNAHVFKKRLYKNGKRCESADEWLSGEIWQSAWLLKMRELSKRLSGNPAVFMIELWNEMNCVSDKHLISWNKKMLAEVKKLFPNHLVTNSIGSFDSDTVKKLYDDFCWENADVYQVHRYLDGGAEYEICRNEPALLIKDASDKLLRNDMPFLVAETGAVNNCHSGPFRFYDCDHSGIIFCDAVYTPVFCGAAGCGNIWHWDGRYIESKNLYHYFKPLKKLCRGIEFDKEDFKSGFYEDDELRVFINRGRSVTIGYIRNKSYNWKNILRDLKEPSVVKDKLIPVECRGEIEQINIQKWERGRVISEKGKLRVIDLKFGLMFKIKNL